MAKEKDDRLKKDIDDLTKIKSSLVAYLNKSRIRIIYTVKRKSIEKNIFEDISLLKNMILASKESFGSDMALSYLAERESKLQSAYYNFLTYLRTNMKEEALENFCKEVPSPYAGEFASLLLKWDDLNPTELFEVLISMQKSIREKRITEQKSMDENMSDLIYLPVVLNVMLIFVNFIYVGYFIKQQELLNLLI